MTLATTLQDLDLAPGTMVKLSFEDDHDVFHYTEDYHDEVIFESGIIREIAMLLERFGDDVSDGYGNILLQDLRSGGFLEEYERDDTFCDYLEEVMSDNYHELEIIEFSTHKYDHKRGRCTVSATFEVPISRLLDDPWALNGWKAAVQTAHGMLMMG